MNRYYKIIILIIGSLCNLYLYSFNFLNFISKPLVGTDFDNLFGLSFMIVPISFGVTPLEAIAQAILLLIVVSIFIFFAYKIDSKIKSTPVIILYYAFVLPVSFILTLSCISLFSFNFLFPHLDVIINGSDFQGH